MGQFLARAETKARRASRDPRRFAIKPSRSFTGRYNVRGLDKLAYARSFVRSVMKDLTGATVGSYDVKERLGAGGMAGVYRAIQQPLGREVPLQALIPTLLPREGF